MTMFRSTARQFAVAAKALALFTLLLGIAYPLLATAAAQTAAGHLANGSPVSAGGNITGSALLGQSFTDDSGAALPQWFQSRPGTYDGAVSGGSNLGPSSTELAEALEERRQAVAGLESVPAADVPADALTASASGLDPHISPEYAYLQAARVAQARELPEPAVRALVDTAVQGRIAGFMGEPTVNVLELNMALRELDN
ncbi:potassium-transporting ATPase subunit KdpC [Arthrobacter gandavensis]|uniref:potassium-transporting ATPase subunit KdpC n=1 Tax=Arthrobacter gandavensis TaxID=169960 RepID=UPI00188E6D08|nr:potassium-transporting ATPase subunit KdpC [Arthrobacter gandavensis]MBF4992587.1 potassium-transporting ATPase subunit KdpC [Arthrobacter gandavensis]